MTAPRGPADQAALHAELERQLADAPPGRALAPLTRALVGYGVLSSVTVLDLVGARRCAAAALDLGAGPAQLQEVLTLVSGLGLHTLMEGSRDLADLVAGRGGTLPALDDGRTALRERLLGGAGFWHRFEHHVPGFLEALLRLSPEAFGAFVRYGAVPARTGHLPALDRELVSVAVDALPNHRYLPGLRLHVEEALRLGAGRAEVLEAAAVAEGTPPPRGVA